MGYSKNISPHCKIACEWLKVGNYCSCLHLNLNLIEFLQSVVESGRPTARYFWERVTVAIEETRWNSVGLKNHFIAASSELVGMFLTDLFVKNHYNWRRDGMYNGTFFYSVTWFVYGLHCVDLYYYPVSSLHLDILFRRGYNELLNSQRIAWVLFGLWS